MKSAHEEGSFVDSACSISCPSGSLASKDEMLLPVVLLSRSPVFCAKPLLKTGLDTSERNFVCVSISGAPGRFPDFT